jgi:hypothetical protein
LLASPQPGVSTGRLVIFVDEIDIVRSLPFSTDEFFAAIRECYNRRTEDPSFNRLAFCLLGVAAPSDLIRDTGLTPFNIGRRVELNDFSEQEATVLITGLGVAKWGCEGGGELSNRLLERILYWTNGHPYLTQRVCNAVAHRNADSTARAQAALQPGCIDRLCEELFFAQRARERDDNLLFVRERILRPDLDRTSLLDLYARVRRGRTVRCDDGNESVSLLRLAGLVRMERGRLLVRNRVYARVFDPEWVTAHLPDAERRRQRRAFRRGSATAAAAFAVFLGAALGWRSHLERTPTLVLPAPPLPATNAHYLYQTAGRLVVGTNETAAIYSRPGARSVSAMEDVLRLNSNSLALVRIGFQYPCRFPAMRSSTIQEDYVALGRVSHLLLFEGEVFEGRGLMAEASRSYLDLVRFGEDVSRGTPMLGRLIGISFSWRGTFHLARITPVLDAQTCREASVRLSGLRRSATTFQETLLEEKLASQAALLELFQRADWRSEPIPPLDLKRVFGMEHVVLDVLQQREVLPLSERVRRRVAVWHHTGTRSKHALLAELSRFFDSWLAVAHGALPTEGDVPPAPTDRVLKQIHNPQVLLQSWRNHLNWEAQLALLEVALSLQALRLERGALPTSLDQLVPRWLDQAPLDPFAPKQFLRYRLVDGHALLYSVGPDGKDDGGQSEASGLKNGRGDLLLGGFDLRALSGRGSSP